MNNTEFKFLPKTAKHSSSRIMNFITEEERNDRISASETISKFEEQQMPARSKLEMLKNLSRTGRRAMPN